MIDPLLMPTILSITIQGIIGIISQIQHSRCSEIRACGIECKREGPKEQKKVDEIKNKEERQSKNEN